MTTTEVLTLGAVAYDPKVVTIWEGFKDYLGRRGLSVDYVLYSNYERQVQDLIGGKIDLAWNSPLAWVRARRLAASRGDQVMPLVMRDADRALTSSIVVRSDDPSTTVNDLRGRRIGVGAVDSPQATLIPLLLLHEAGIDPANDVEVIYHDVFAGKHGDHGTAERMAVKALVEGTVDAACVLTGNDAAAEVEEVVPAGSVRTLAVTGTFDHCNFTQGATPHDVDAKRFGELLMQMSYEDPDVRPLCELEGFKRWEIGRSQGYELLERAVDVFGFYSIDGAITADDYRY
ncbi:MAG: PhnD/SsuA/transferrin family substrate-binding protein [Actinomycetota bacterium]